MYIVAVNGFLDPPSILCRCHRNKRANQHSYRYLWIGAKGRDPQYVAEKYGVGRCTLRTYTPADLTGQSCTKVVVVLVGSEVNVVLARVLICNAPKGGFMCAHKHAYLTMYGSWKYTLLVRSHVVTATPGDVRISPRIGSHPCTQ